VRVLKGPEKFMETAIARMAEPLESVEQKITALLT
jgi:hypothetical protein